MLIIFLAWLRDHPIGFVTKPVFLEILEKTQVEVFTESCIKGAWAKSRCWPILRDSDTETKSTGTSTSIPGPKKSTVSENVSDNLRALAMDTPAKLRALAQRVEDITKSKLPDPDDQSDIYGLIDFFGEKLTKHRDIMPRADILSKLWSGKVRRVKRSCRHIGESRVLTYQHVNDGLKKLAEDVAEKLERQWVSIEIKKAAEEKKAAREALEQQWRIDRQHFDEVILPTWKAECMEIDVAWTAAKQLGQRGKRPPYPPKPKRPIKPKERPLGDLSAIIRLVGVPEEEEDILDEEADEAGDNAGIDDDDLVDSMPNLEIGHFAEVSTMI